MNMKPQKGYLVLAHFSGNGAWQAAAGLEHARQHTSEFLEFIANALSEVLSVVRLEDTAVFAYAGEDRLGRSETLVELVEVTYKNFRARLETSRRMNTCDCKACRNLGSLDLKFYLHYGEYALRTAGGWMEPVGSDVYLAHRLIKNGVGDALGWRSYILFTRRCLEKLHLPPDDMYYQVELYEHIGAIPTFSLNLHDRYKAMTDNRYIRLTPEKADLTFTVDVTATPPIVWEWLNDPLKRLEWSGPFGQDRRQGRTGVGTVNHRAHGKHSRYTYVENILDWRPFEYYTIDTEVPLLKSLLLTITYNLLPTASGTSLQVNMKGRMAGPRWLLNLFTRFSARRFKKDLRTLALKLKV